METFKLNKEKENMKLMQSFWTERGGSWSLKPNY